MQGVPTPRQPQIERVVPPGATHLGVSCVLPREHAGSCLPAPRRMVLVPAAVA